MVRASCCGDRTSGRRPGHPAAGAGRVFHNSIPPSKQNQLGKLPRVRLCAPCNGTGHEHTFRFLVGFTSGTVMPTLVFTDVRVRPPR